MNSADNVQTALYSALLAGSFESPPWFSYLELLRQATGAEFSTLHFRPPGRPMTEALDLFSGSVAIDQVIDVNRRYFADDSLAASVEMVEGKPYSLAELVALHRDLDSPFVDFLRTLPIAGIIQLRVREASGVDGWLTVASRTNPFNENDSALMATQVPLLRGVLRHHVALEREKYVNSLMAEPARRLRFGWLALSAEGRILASDDQGRQILGDSRVLRQTADGQLLASTPALRREIDNALNHIASQRPSRAFAITLQQDPWLDMLLVPTSRRSVALGVLPAAIAYIHGDSWLAADCCDQLAELFGLSPSEARLALAVCRGMTISEAAEAQGLSEGSARTYTKTIYAKTGARGLPDLVRIVMRSVLAIAPET